MVRSILSAMGLGINIPDKVEEEVKVYVKAKVEISKEEVRATDMLKRYLVTMDGNLVYRGLRLTAKQKDSIQGLSPIDTMFQLELIDKKETKAKLKALTKSKPSNDISIGFSDRLAKRVAKQELDEVKASKAKNDKRQEIVKVDPLSGVRTDKENEVAEAYIPQSKVDEEVVPVTSDIETIQVISDLIETHIVASTLGRQGLDIDDYKLDGKTFFNMVVDNINDPQNYSPSINSDRHEVPYTYNFNQAHKIHSEFTNRYRDYRIVDNRNAITYNITININS